ncbi:MAG: transglutaminase-like domain-containing protein [Candidatus ainarchaeum sp.]|nr:transglutaminase-like domain-containing protein [Candidatus ainarchaeum sp.]
MYKRAGILIISVVLLVLFGCASPGPGPMDGNDTDAHGCIGSAGYVWCDYSQQCIRPWEENCTSPDGLSAQADALYADYSFTAANGLYSQAREEYLAGGNAEGARRSLDRINSMNRILMEFQYTNESAVYQQISEVLPNASQEQMRAWLSTQYLMIDGTPHYFYSAGDNVLFSNTQVKRQMLRESNRSNVMTELFDSVLEGMDGAHPTPYSNPVNYTGVENLYIPRSELPASGVLRLWMPVPIDTDSQKDARVVSITPDDYLVGAPTTDGDIGLAYMEVPLENLGGDLNITIVFAFTSYEQHFEIDSGNVGEYDTESGLYQKYTGSSENIVVSPEVRELALEAVGNETNPYLQAEKLYWFVINTTEYHFVPHVTLSELGIPESEYARVNHIGDCGTQSMYFSALARSIGIPARASGGYQMFGGGTGSHFWAQFYLPNYGWVPADVTAAEAADWVYEPSDAANHAVKGFFFGNLDVTRFVIQDDVDLPVAPPAQGRVFFPMVRQFPAAELDTDDDDIGAVVAGSFTIKVSPA